MGTAGAARGVKTHVFVSGDSLVLFTGAGRWNAADLVMGIAEQDHESNETGLAFRFNEAPVSYEGVDLVQVKGKFTRYGASEVRERGFHKGTTTRMYFAVDSPVRGDVVVHSPLSAVYGCTNTLVEGDAVLLGMGKGSKPSTHVAGTTHYFAILKEVLLLPEVLEHEVEPHIPPNYAKELGDHTRADWTFNGPHDAVVTSTAWRFVKARRIRDLADYRMVVLLVLEVLVIRAAKAARLTASTRGGEEAVVRRDELMKTRNKFRGGESFRLLVLPSGDLRDVDDVPTGPVGWDGAFRRAMGNTGTASTSAGLVLLVACHSNTVEAELVITHGGFPHTFDGSRGADTLQGIHLPSYGYVNGDSPVRLMICEHSVNHSGYSNEVPLVQAIAMTAGSVHQRRTSLLDCVLTIANGAIAGVPNFLAAVRRETGFGLLTSMTQYGTYTRYEVQIQYLGAEDEACFAPAFHTGLRVLFSKHFPHSFYITMEAYLNLEKSKTLLLEPSATAVDLAKLLISVQGVHVPQMALISEGQWRVAHAEGDYEAEGLKLMRGVEDKGKQEAKHTCSFPVGGLLTNEGLRRYGRWPAQTMTRKMVFKAAYERGRQNWEEELFPGVIWRGFGVELDIDLVKPTFIKAGLREEQVMGAVKLFTAGIWTGARFTVDNREQANRVIEAFKSGGVFPHTKLSFEGTGRPTSSAGFYDGTGVDSTATAESFVRGLLTWAKSSTTLTHTDIVSTATNVNTTATVASASAAPFSGASGGRAPSRGVPLSAPPPVGSFAKDCRPTSSAHAAAVPVSGGGMWRNEVLTLEVSAFGGRKVQGLSPPDPLTTAPIPKAGMGDVSEVPFSTVLNKRSRMVNAGTTGEGSGPGSTPNTGPSLGSSRTGPGVRRGRRAGSSSWQGYSVLFNVTDTEDDLPSEGEWKEHVDEAEEAAMAIARRKSKRLEAVANEKNEPDRPK